MPPTNVNDNNMPPTRKSMAVILEIRADHPPATTRSTIEKSPPIKIDFKEFSGEPQDWTTRSKVDRA